MRHNWSCLFILGLTCSGLQLGCDEDDRAADDEAFGSSADPLTRAGAAGSASIADAGPACAPAPCSGGVELPADQHYAADGLCVRAVALRQSKLRQLAFAPNGDLFGVTIKGEIRRYRDANCDGQFSDSEQVVWANTAGSNDNSVHVHAVGGETFVYAGTPQGVARFRYDPQSDRAGEREDVMIAQPTTGRHMYGTVHIYDGYLYVQSGSGDNVVPTATGEYDTDRSLIKRWPLRRFNPRRPFEWQRGEIFADGLRNTVGFTRDAAGELWGVVNGIDDLYYDGQDVHLNNPGEMVVKLEQGAGYGFPFCFAALDLKNSGGERLAVGSQRKVELGPSESFDNPHDDSWCSENARVPESLLDPHSAPLDIVYVEQPGSALLEHYARGAFVSIHGSWNTEPSTGHKVVWLPWNESGRPELPTVDEAGVRYPYEVVFGGGQAGAPKDGIWGWQAADGGEDVVRPVGVAISPIDGALYVSSDNGKVKGSGDMSTEDGVLYRVTRR
jgi:glucose/arabinose dehydrogenase